MASQTDPLAFPPDGPDDLPDLEPATTRHRARPAGKLNLYGEVLASKNKNSGRTPATQDTTRSLAQEGAKVKMDEFMEYVEKKKRFFVQKDMWNSFFGHLLFVIALLAYLFYQRPVIFEFDMENGLKDVIVQEEFLSADSPSLRKTFNDIGSIEEYWQWVRGPLLGAYYKEEVYSMSDLPLAGDTTAVAQGTQRYLLDKNIAIGALRFHQLRVDTEGCSGTATDLGESACYPEWTEDSNSEASFGNGLYTYEKNVGRSNEFFFGSVSTLPRKNVFPTTYIGDGFKYDFEKSWNSTYAMSQLATLMNNQWVDTQTRVVIHYLTVYNPSFDMFASCQFMVQFSISGMVYVKDQVRVLPTPTFETKSRVFAYYFGLPAIFLLWWYKTLRLARKAIDDRRVFRHLRGLYENILIYSAKAKMLHLPEIQQETVETGCCRSLKGCGGKTYHDAILDDIPTVSEEAGIFAWDLIECVLIFMMLVLDFIFIVNWRQDWSETDFATVVSFTDEITYSAHLSFLTKQMQSLLIFVSVIKFFSGLRAVPNIRLMWQMLHNARDQLIWFFVFFMVIFMAFAFAAHFSFGENGLQFSSIWRVMAFQLGALFGDINYDELHGANRVLGPMYYFTYLMSMTLVIINVFIGIISTAYEEMYKSKEFRSQMNEESISILKATFKENWLVRFFNPYTSAATKYRQKFPETCLSLMKKAIYAVCCRGGVHHTIRSDIVGRALHENYFHVKIHVLMAKAEENAKLLPAESLALSFESVVDIFCSMFSERFCHSDLFICGFLLGEDDDGFEDVDIAEGWDRVHQLWDEKMHPNPQGLESPEKRGAESWKRAYRSLVNKEDPMERVCQVISACKRICEFAHFPPFYVHCLQSSLDQLRQESIPETSQQYFEDEFAKNGDNDEPIELHPIGSDACSTRPCEAPGLGWRALGLLLLSIPKVWTEANNPKGGFDHQLSKEHKFQAVAKTRMSTSGLEAKGLKQVQDPWEWLLNEKLSELQRSFDVIKDETKNDIAVCIIMLTRAVLKSVEPCAQSFRESFVSPLGKETVLLKGDARIVAVYMASVSTCGAKVLALENVNQREISDELKGIHQLYSRQDADFELLHESNQNLTKMVLGLCHDSQRKQMQDTSKNQSSPSAMDPEKLHQEIIAMSQRTNRSDMQGSLLPGLLTNLRALLTPVALWKHDNSQFEDLMNSEELEPYIELLGCHSQTEMTLSVGDLIERGYLDSSCELAANVQDEHTILLSTGMSPQLYEIARTEVRHECLELRKQCLQSTKGIKVMQTFVREFFSICAGWSKLKSMRLAHEGKSAHVLANVELPMGMKKERQKWCPLPEELNLTNKQCIELVFDLSTRDLYDMGYIDDELTMHLADRDVQYLAQQIGLDTVNPSYQQDTCVETQKHLSGTTEDAYNELRRMVLEPYGLASDPHAHEEVHDDSEAPEKLKNMELLQSGGLDSLSEYITSFNESHGTRKMWNTGLTGFELTMQELIHCRYGEVRRSEHTLLQQTETEETPYYKLGVDTLWKYEKLRQSLQAPFTTRYKYPTVNLNYSTIDRLSQQAYSIEQAAQKQEKDDEQLGFENGTVVDIPHLMTASNINWLRRRADYRSGTDVVLLTVNAMSGANVASYQTDMLCVVSYIDFEGKMHEKRSPVVLDNSSPVWNFSVHLHLYDSSALDDPEKKSRLEEHQKEAAMVSFKIYYRQQGVNGLQIFAEANRLCLAGRSMSAGQEEHRASSTTVSRLEFLLAQERNQSRLRMESRPASEEWPAGSKEGCFFGDNIHGPIYFFPTKQQSAPDLTQETKCDLDLYHPGAHTKKSGSLSVFIRKIPHYRTKPTSTFDVDDGSPISVAVEGYGGVATKDRSDFDYDEPKRRAAPGEDSMSPAG